jgi:hypothetical protein
MRCEHCFQAAVGACCSSHNKQLCHYCYRKTHFVEVCVEDCRNCAAEGLPAVLPREMDRVAAVLHRAGLLDEAGSGDGQQV